nr:MULTISPECIES: tautomerase family protein [Mycobacterium avium complex (MAC)]
MPLLYIDLIEGRTPSEVSALLDAIHDTVVDAFGVRRGIATRWCIPTRHTKSLRWTPVWASIGRLARWSCTW